MTDVFSDDNANPAPVTQSEYKLEDLVGDGKKYKTMDDFVRSRKEADDFIKQLQEENKGLREAVQKQFNAEDNLNSLKQELAELKAKLQTQSEPKPNTTEELTTEKLEQIVAGVITKQEQSKTASQNLAAANAEMEKQYGEKAVEVFKQRAAAVGMTTAELKSIASRSPTAFYQIIGINKDKSKDNVFDTHSPSVNTAALPNVSPEAKRGTRAYYNQLRKTLGNDKFFADVNLQKEIFEAKKKGIYDS